MMFIKTNMLLPNFPKLWTRETDSCLSLAFRKQIRAAYIIWEDGWILLQLYKQFEAGKHKGSFSLSLPHCFAFWTHWAKELVQL